jgi:hypothetical protein
MNIVHSNHHELIIGNLGSFAVGRMSCAAGVEEAPSTHDREQQARLRETESKTFQRVAAVGRSRHFCSGGSRTPCAALQLFRGPVGAPESPSRGA